MEASKLTEQDMEDLPELLITLVETIETITETLDEVQKRVIHLENAVDKLNIDALTKGVQNAGSY